MDLTEGSIAKFLQSAGTNANKKVQGLMPKYGQSAWTNDIFKPTFFYGVLSKFL